MLSAMRRYAQNVRASLKFIRDANEINREMSFIYSGLSDKDAERLSKMDFLAYSIILSPCYILGSAIEPTISSLYGHFKNHRN